jgi:hypothetical protein
VNDIVDVSCPICGKKKSFVKYRGYRETCGSNSCATKYRYRDESSRRKTGNSNKEVRREIKKYYEEGLNKLDEFKYEALKGDGHFTSRKVVDSWLGILNKSKHEWPIKNIPSFMEIKARYYLIENGKPKCKICRKEHLDYDNRTGKFKELCGKEECKTEKLRQKRIKKYKRILFNDEYEIVKLDDFITKQKVVLKCKEGHEFERWMHGVYRNKIICPICTPYGSSYETEIYKLFNKDYKIEQNTKSIIKPLELDLYFEKEKLAIEINGDYWHSYNRLETKKEKFYHFNKFLKCKEKDIKLFQIKEYDWNKNKDFYINQIRSYLDKSAILNYKIRNLNNNFYLINENEVIAIMSIKENIIKFSCEKNSEICSKLLFNFIITKQNIKNLFIKSNNSFDILDYKKLGFKFIEFENPSFSYCIPGKEFIKSDNNPELLFSFGYRRYWDAGYSYWLFSTIYNTF